MGKMLGKLLPEVVEKPVVRVRFKARVIELYNNEFEQLLEALRRDLHAERSRRDNCAAEFRFEHGYHAQCDLHLLEVLQPKHTTPYLSAKEAQALQPPATTA